MANKKIENLTQLVTGASGNLIVIEDELETKKMTLEDFRKTLSPVFAITKEDSNGLSLGFDFFAKDSVNPSGLGVVLAEDCELISIGLDIDKTTAGTCELTVLKNGSETLYTIQSTGSDIQSFTGFADPLSFEAGDFFNIKTTQVDASNNDARVSLFFRKTF
ncbi:MAG: hypothetical protein ACO3HJ_00690 [Methylophilaceae bacterium]